MLYFLVFFFISVLIFAGYGYGYRAPACNNISSCALWSSTWTSYTADCPAHRPQRQPTFLIPHPRARASMSELRFRCQLSLSLWLLLLPPELPLLPLGRVKFKASHFVNFMRFLPLWQYKSALDSAHDYLPAESRICLGLWANFLLRNQSYERQ